MLGRDYHARVSLNAGLKARNMETWIDEDRMSGFIRQKMAGGNI